MTLLRTRLTSRLSLRDVKEICLLAQGESNNAVKDELYRLSLDADHREMCERPMGVHTFHERRELMAIRQAR